MAAQYVLIPGSGFYHRVDDDTGPYVQTSPGVYALAGNGSGGGGGGGAVTVADGADVAEGAVADAAVAAGATGTVSAKLRAISRDIGPATLLADISGTIAAGGAAQNAAGANAVRRGFSIQNQSSGDLWFSTLAAAVQSQPSIKLSAGAYYETPPGGAGTGAISVIGATTGQAFAGRQW
jgi:hypothetical protein